MVINQKIKVTLILFAAVVIGVAAIKPPKHVSEFKNLQVLPKDISSKELQQIMVDEFQDGLGVACSYCHAAEKGSMHLDFASDEKPEKEIARLMMKMTNEMNTKYFNVEHPIIGDTLSAVTCSTCHQGNVRPVKQ